MPQRLRWILVSYMLFMTLSCSHYYKFDELYDKGQYLEAYRVLSQISSVSNVQYQRRLYRVVIRLALDGDPDFIAQLSSLTLESPARDVSDYSRFGNLYAQFLKARTIPDYQAVVKGLKEIRNVPEEFIVYLHKIRGISLYHTGRYREAMADLESSYRMGPYLDNLYYIGLCHIGLKETDNAIVYFERIITRSQSDFLKSLAFFQKGEILYGQTNYSAALQDYISAVNTYSGNADITFKIAKCMQKLKLNRFSQRFMKTSLRIKKDYANAWFYLNVN